MSKIVQNGNSVDVQVQAGQSLKIAWLGGTYTATAVAGGLPNLPAVQGSANSTADQTLGPYTNAVVIRIKASAIGAFSYDSGAVLAFRPPGQRFVRQSDGVPVVLTGVDTAAAFSVEGGGNGTVAVTASRAITASDNGKTLEATVPLTLTEVAGVSASYFVIPPPIGSVAIASDGTTTLNGSTAPATRNAALNTTTVKVTERATNPNASLVSGTAAAAFLGQVAGQCRFPNSRANVATIAQYNARTSHDATDDISVIRIAFTNCYVTAAFAESGTGGTVIHTGCIEYPAGTFNRVTWSASNTCTIADGANGALSDPLTLSVPIPKGAVFWVRTNVSVGGGSLGPVYCGTPTPTETAMWTATRGDAWEYSSTTVTDKTMSGTIPVTGTGSSIGLMPFPVAIVATTTKPSVLICGTSRPRGVRDTIDAAGTKGTVERSLGAAGIGYINVAIPGDRVNMFNTNSAKRRELAAYCNNVIFEYAINDLNVSGDSAATVLANLQTAWAFFSGKPVFQTTPEPTSTGTFTTVAGQTPAASEAQRQLLITSIKAMPTGMTNYFDVNSALEAAGFPGRWVANYTGDGLHAYVLGNQAVQAAGVIRTSEILY